MYKKPKDITYTEMAIWLDAHMYDEDVDENTVFQYLWLLVMMLARKANYFNRNDYYEDFATYMATYLYFRIKNPAQFDDGSKLKKIKSILNYIKGTIYPRKVDFEQEFYSQVMSKPVDEEDAIINSGYSFADLLSESVDEISRVEFDVCLHDVVRTFRAYLKTIPYYGNKVEWNNIYISCLLTLLNSITVNKKIIDKISSFKYKDIQDSVQRIWKHQLDNQIILFHLDEEMKDYIRILVREMLYVFAQDLSSYMHTYIPSNSALSYVALSEINNKSQYSWGESYNDEN